MTDPTAIVRASSNAALVLIVIAIVAWTCL